MAKKKMMKWKLKRMTPEEIKDVARKVVTNQVYITNTEEGLRFSFGLTLTLIASEVPRREFLKIGACYCDWDKAMPRGINGYPCFGSASLVHWKDMPFLRAEIENMETALGTPP